MQKNPENISSDQVILSVYPGSTLSSLSVYDKTTQKISCSRFEEPENFLNKYNEILSQIIQSDFQLIVLPKTGFEDFVNKLKRSLGVDSNEVEEKFPSLYFLKKTGQNPRKSHIKHRMSFLRILSSRGR